MQEEGNKISRSFHKYFIQVMEGQVIIFVEEEQGKTLLNLKYLMIQMLKTKS